MTAPVTAPPVWSVVERAVMAAGEARLDLDTPQRGLVLPTGDTVLGVDLRTPCRPSDRWLRDDDLIAIYEPADARRLRATAAWRPFAHPDAAACSAWMLTLSAQTALVQSDSALAVTCDVACADLRVSHDPADMEWTPIAADGQLPDGSTCLLVRRTVAPATSLFVAVHPADARRIVVRRAGDRATIDCWLFSSLIEKGVLLRGRVLAAVGPAAGDTAWAATLGAAFAAAPPPLTA